MTIEPRTYTLVDFQRLAAENPDRLLELIDGRIVQKGVKRKHGLIALLIGAAFNRYLLPNKLGMAGAETDYKAQKDDRHFLRPDVAVYLGDVQQLVEDDDITIPPVIAVEIKSPSNDDEALRYKARWFLEHDVKMVWLVFPDEQHVEVYVGEEMTEYRQADTITLAPILPNYQIAVSEFLQD